MIKKILHAKPSYTNTSGSDQVIPASYNPTLTHTVIKASYTVPSGKKILVRNILVYRYHVTAIKNAVSAVYKLRGSPLIAINDEISILTDLEKVIGEFSNTGTYPLTFYPFVCNLSMFMVLEPGDTLEVGIALRSESASFSLVPDSTQSINVLVSGAEI